MLRLDVLDVLDVITRQGSCAQVKVVLFICGG